MDERWQTGALRGRYRLAERLGAGGMGEVWAAEDPQLGRRVALKRLLAELASVPEAIARFEQEARTLAAVSSDHIASLHGVERTADGEPFLVMEYVEGKSLRDILSRGALPVDEAMRLFAQLALALSAAHRAGVVHRDLKPSNLIVRSDGLLVVVDFGVARKAEEGAIELTRSGTIIGSAAYMSPQQAAGERVGASADVWSAGVTLFEMLTGELPFEGTNAAEMSAAVLRDSPRPLRDLRPDIPRALASCVDRCLRKPVHERPRDGAELLDLLPPVPLPSAAARGALWGPELIARGAAHPPLSRTQRWAAVVAALLALAIGQLGATWAWRGIDTWIRPDDAQARADALLGAEAVAALPHRVSGTFVLNEQPGATVRRGRASFYRYRGLATGDYPPPMHDEVRLAFTADGALRRYEWFPDDGPTVDVERDAIFEAAGIDGPIVLEPTDRVVRGRPVLEGTVGDTRVALAESGDAVLFFDRTDLPPLQRLLRTPRPHQGRYAGLVALIIVVVLAWYQRRRGRGDIRGAAVSGMIAMSLILAAVSGTPELITGGGWRDELTSACAVALAVAFIYFAAEPIVRQRWPGALAGWERLVHWRTGSHVLGRELLLGAAAALPVTAALAIQTGLPHPRDHRLGGERRRRVPLRHHWGRDPLGSSPPPRAPRDPRSSPPPLAASP